MNTIIKNTLALFTITAVAGILLGAVYEGTKTARAEQEKKTQQKAYQTVFADADSFADIVTDSSVNIKEVREALGYSEKEVELNSIVKALGKDGELLGYVITVTAKEGYDGDIKFSVGVSIDHLVTGISYLSITETAGLGMKAKDEAYIDMYVKGSAEGEGDFIVNKDGNDGIVIDAISGATITSRAVTKGVNAACHAADYLMDGGVQDE